MGALALCYFFAIVKPLKYADFIAGDCPWISIIAIWTLSALLGFIEFPLQFIFPQNIQNRNTSYCETVAMFPSAFSLWLYLPATAVVLVMYVVIYLKSFTVLYQRGNRRLSTLSTNNRSLRKGLMTMSLFLATFLFLYLPFDILKFTFWHNSQELNRGLIMLLSIAKKVNCIFDPLIFAARDEDVINGLRSLFHCNRVRVAMVNSDTSDGEEKASCIMCRRSPSRHNT